MRIVIIGGGFAGAQCAKTLRKRLPKARVEIVLFSRENNMVFYPLLAEVAGAAINPGAVTVPFTTEEVSVTLVHARDQILPEVRQTLREFARMKMEQAGIQVVLNARAVMATAERVELHDGRMLRGATVIGTTAPLLVHRLDVPKEGGRLLADPDMRVRGASNLWAIGDCAHIINAYDGQVSPTTGQFAKRQGRQTADNIVRLLQGQPTRPFSYRPLGQLGGIGERNAVAEILGERQMRQARSVHARGFARRFDGRQDGKGEDAGG